MFIFEKLIEANNGMLASQKWINSWIKQMDIVVCFKQIQIDRRCLPASRVVCLPGCCIHLGYRHRWHHPMVWGQIWLASTPDWYLGDVGYFLNMGRHHMSEKDGMVAGSISNVTSHAAVLSTSWDDLCLYSFAVFYFL